MILKGMMTVKIAVVTDSTCDLPREFFDAQENLFMVPLKVIFGEDSFYDGIDITSREFFDKLKTDSRHPSTSQPSMGEFLEKYQEISRDYDQIISIHISSKLSGTIESANLAAREVENVRVEIVDSFSTTLGLGFLVKLALKLIDSGKEIEEIVKILQETKSNVDVYFTVSDLSFLQKGGRIGKAQAFLGSILNFHPLLSLPGSQGEVMPLEKVRGRKRMKEKFSQIIKDKLTAEQAAWLAFLHGDAKERGQELREYVLEMEEVKNTELEISETIISPVLGCHAGPSVYGIAVVTGDILAE